jgi:hypothetical protein
MAKNIFRKAKVFEVVFNEENFHKPLHVKP